MLKRANKKSNKEFNEYEIKLFNELNDFFNDDQGDYEYLYPVSDLKEYEVLKTRMKFMRTTSKKE